jgi:hypothetical protein
LFIFATIIFRVFDEMMLKLSTKARSDDNNVGIVEAKAERFRRLLRLRWDLEGTGQKREYGIKRG